MVTCYLKHIKGNVHSHTTRSDGDYDVDTLRTLYAANGYGFIAVTDHRRYYKNEDSCLNGCEYNCYLAGEPPIQFHLLALDNGTSAIAHDDTTLSQLYYTTLDEVQALIDLLKAAGNMVFVAHPKDSKIPIQLLKTLKNYDGIEVYNAKADSDASDYFDALLELRDIQCLAVDDAHRQSVGGKTLFYKGYIVIEDGLAPLEALVSGRYYSSTGVRINTITVKKRTVQVQAEGKVTLYLYTSLRECRLYSNASVHLPREIVAFRAVCRQEDKKAWTNLIYV